MMGFIARTGIPFGSLTVSFGYGLGVGPAPPPVVVQVEPTILEDRPGPGTRGAYQRQTRGSLRAQGVSYTAITTALSGSRTLSAQSTTLTHGTRRSITSRSSGPTLASKGRRTLTVAKKKG